MTKGNNNQKVKRVNRRLEIQCGICKEMTKYRFAVFDNLLRMWVHFECLEKERKKMMEELREEV